MPRRTAPRRPAIVDEQTVSVAIAGDTWFEADETFFLNVSSATNGATTSDGSGTGTIGNDDINPAWVPRRNS